jgi:hypothetical protein
VNKYSKYVSASIFDMERVIESTHPRGQIYLSQKRAEKQRVSSQRSGREVRDLSRGIY